MSQGRIKLLVAGIVSLLLLSSFSVWRIYLDGKRIHTSIENYSLQQTSGERINDLILLITLSDHLTDSWVFFPKDVEAKLKLRQLHETTYPLLRTKIDSISIYWQDSHRSEMISILTFTDTLIMSQKRITTQLQKPDNYQKPSILATVEDILETKVAPASKNILNRLYLLRDHFKTSTSRAWAQSDLAVESADEVSLLLSVLMFTSGIIGLIIVLSAKKNQP